MHIILLDFDVDIFCAKSKNLKWFEIEKSYIYLWVQRTNIIQTTNKNKKNEANCRNILRDVFVFDDYKLGIIELVKTNIPRLSRESITI